MKKILFVIDTLGPSGAERSTLQIAENLREFTPIICTIYAKYKKMPPPDGLQVRHVDLNSKGKYAYLDNARKLRRMIKDIQPELVVSTLFRANFITRIAMLGLPIPLIGTFVNDDYPMSKFRAAGVKGKLFFLHRYVLDRLTVRRNRHIVANSQAIAKLNGDKLGVEKRSISVIHRGRQPTAPHYTSHREGEVFRFINVGRLTQQKGQTDLLAAFSLLQEKYDNLSLTIAGHGQLEGVLKKQRDELPRPSEVDIPGRVYDIPARLAAAHVFVFTSHFEGFSGALVEAMMAGKLIICSDIPMNLEAVEADKSALVYPVGDVAALAATMERAMTNYKDLLPLMQTAHKEATARFTLKQAIERYENLYLKTIAS